MWHLLHPDSPRSLRFLENGPNVFLKSPLPLDFRISLNVKPRSSWCLNCILPSSGCFPTLLILPDWMAECWYASQDKYIKSNYINIQSHLMNTCVQKHAVVVHCEVIKLCVVVSRLSEIYEFPLLGCWNLSLSELMCNLCDVSFALLTVIVI